MLIFLVGLIFLLVGVLIGGALCVGYLRREIADDIGPKLKRMQFQLDNIEAELNLAITTRHAELSPYQATVTSRQRRQNCPCGNWRNRLADEQHWNLDSTRTRIAPYRSGESSPAIRWFPSAARWWQSVIIGQKLR